MTSGHPLLLTHLTPLEGVGDMGQKDDSSEKGGVHKGWNLHNDTLLAGFYPPNTRPERECVECISPEEAEKLQVWHADDSDLVPTFTNIKDWFAELCRVGTTIGYYREPANRFPVTSNGNI